LFYLGVPFTGSMFQASFEALSLCWVLEFYRDTTWKSSKFLFITKKLYVVVM